MVRMIVAIACLAVAVPAVLIYSFATYVVWTEGSCPGNQCADDRVIVWMSAVIVPVGCLVSYFALRILLRPRRSA